MSRSRSWLAVVALFALMACGDDNDSSSAGRVRVAHLSPDAGTLQLVVNGQVVLNGFTYPNSSNYFDVNAGTREVRLEPNGGGTPFLSQNVEITGAEDRTLLAVNTAANMEGVDLTDDNTAPVSGHVKVRLVHAVPSVGAVDIYVTAPGAALGTPTVANVPFKGASAYLDLAAGSYEFRVTPAGSATVLIDQTQSLLAGYIVTIAAREADGGGEPLGYALFLDRTP